MKFLCISAASEDSHTEPSRSKLRVWYNSIRRGLKRSKEPRVTISEPIRIETLTQSDLIQINGVIEVKPSGDDNEPDQTVNSVPPMSEPAQDDTDHVDAAIPAAVTGHNPTQLSVPSEESSPERGDTSTAPAASPETAEQLVSYVWFWGSISRKEAESLLRGKKDGSFLVRASSDKRFLYSLSFRSNGKTMHTRIEHSKGQFFFYSNEASSSRAADGSATLGGLITVAMNPSSADSIFFYSRGQRSESSLHTVSLNQPLSRFEYMLDYPYEHTDHKSLQYLCKFIIHHCPAARAKLDQQLHALPVEMRTFAHNAAYFPHKANCQ